MPRGQVQRIDDQRNVAYIAWHGRLYAAPLAEVEPHARVPSARVEFRLVRRHGEETASDVRLRVGTRTNRRQRRFGDLTGARRPGAKTATTASRNLGVDTATPPVPVMRAWLEALADGDLDAAAALYRPDAVLHTPDGDITGHRAVRAALERWPSSDVDVEQADVGGLGRYVRTAWAHEDEEREHSIVSVVDRGSIAKQWIDADPTTIDEGAPGPAHQIVLRGEVPDDARRYGEQRIDHLVESLDLPVRFIRLKLSRTENPAVERWANAEAVLDADGTILRAHASAPTWVEAIDQTTERLRTKIGHDRSRQRTRRRGGRDPVPETLRRGREELPAPTSGADGRPEIVRHRSYAPDELTVDEAAWDLALLDYHFLLFVEAETGDDALLEHGVDGELVLRLRHGATDRALADSVNDVTASTSPVPELRVDEATTLLAGGEVGVVFFTERSSGRGCAVYRRHDGDVGLILPPV